MNNKKNLLFERHLTTHASTPTVTYADAEVARAVSPTKPIFFLTPSRVPTFTSPSSDAVARTPTPSAASPDAIARTLPAAQTATLASTSVSEFQSQSAPDSTTASTQGPLVVSVPVLASRIGTATLFDEAGSAFEFCLDSGACMVCISLCEAERRRLPIEDLPEGFPAVTQADGETGDASVGLARVRLLVPGRPQVLEVPMVVRKRLFCPLLMGRNLISALDAAFGSECVWDNAGRGLATVQRALQAPQHGWMVKARRAVSCPATAFPTQGASMVVEACAWVAESALVDAQGRRAVTVECMFVPRDAADDPAILLGRTTMQARVDWSADGCTDGLRQLLFPLSAVAVMRGPGRQHLLERDERLGRIFVGRSVVLAALAQPSNTAGPSQADLLEKVLQQALQSPLLISLSDKEAARRSISGFLFAEDLPIAGTSALTPFEVKLLPGATPVARRNYGMSYEEELFAEEQIRQWLANGTIERATSPWSSPIVIARHPRTGKLRLCIDFRGLNAATVSDAYLMPLIADIGRSIYGAVVMSKVDLVQGFGQAQVKKESRECTAFNGVRSGQYQFVGSPFGLKNLPAHFQRGMDLVLGDMLWQRAAVYIDDAIVFSRTLEQHHRDLSELAQRFKSANIFVRASKCSFYQSEVEFLGFIFDGQSMRAIPSRIEAILSMDPPANAEQLRSFMGMTGSFRALIHRYAEIAAPLEAMKQKNSKTPFSLQSGSVAWRAFVDLREALAQMPLLAIPNMNIPFHAYADASDTTISFVLCQNQGGVEHVIAFYSKGLEGAQLHWAPPLKESQALKHFMTNGGPAWKFLASGGPHTIYVDSIASSALLSQTLKDPKLIRLATDLQDLPIVLKHIKGSANKSDALTRAPFAKTDPHLLNLTTANPLLLNPAWRALAESAAAHSVATTPHVLAPVNVPALHPRTTRAALVAAQARDTRWAKVMAFIKAGRPGATEGLSFGAAAEEMSRLSRGLVLADDLLVRVTPTRGGDHTAQVVMPEELLGQVLEEAHTDGSHGVHAGRLNHALHDHLALSVWWPEMIEAAAAFQCATCHRQKKEHQPRGGFLHTTLAGRPGQVLSLDLVPMPQAQGFAGFAILVDRWSGFVAVEPYTTHSAKEAVAAFMRGRHQLFRDVRVVRVDADTIFTSNEFRLAIHNCGAEIVTAFPGHQQANFAERWVQTVKELLRCTLDALPIADTWPLVIRDVAMCINSTPNTSKGASPYEILTGIKEPGILPHLVNEGLATLGHVFATRAVLWDTVQESMAKAEVKHAAAYNAHRLDRRFVQGDVVLIRNQRQEAEDGQFNLSPPYDPNPWLVDVVLSEVSLIVRSTEKDSVFRTVHASQLRHAISEIDQRERAADEDAEYVVQKIHKHRGSKNDRRYLVEWGGHHHQNQYTWEKEAVLAEGAEELLARYKSLLSL